jgi:hypothetical protein
MARAGRSSISKHRVERHYSVIKQGVLVCKQRRIDAPESRPTVMPQRIFDARSPCVQARQRAHGYGCTRATGGRCRFFYKNRDVYDGAFRRGSPHGHGMCVPWHSGAQRRQSKPLCTRGYAMLRSSTPQRFSRPRTLEHAILHTAAHVSVSTACRCLPASSTHSHGSRDDSVWHRANSMRQVLVLLGAQLRRRVPR